MADSYLGEVRIFAGTFAPAGWLICGGQLLPISGYEALYSLLGTQYGGDGTNTFGLPDLRSRVAIGVNYTSGGGGNHLPAANPAMGNYLVGSTGGAENVTLTPNNLPAHTHTVNATTNASSTASPSGNMLASTTATVKMYVPSTSATNAPLAASTVSTYTPSSSQGSISLIKPYVALNYIISTTGIYPTFNN